MVRKSQKSSDHFDHLKTSELIAKERDLSQAMIRCDGRFANALEKLRVECEVVTGKIISYYSSPTKLGLGELIIYRGMSDLKN